MSSMRMKPMLAVATLCGFAATLATGCGPSEVPMVTAPAYQAPPAQPLPKDVKKGGGPSSSGNMKMNPGASS